MKQVNNNLRQFIADFNFAEPDWSKLPPGFPNCDKHGLNYVERTLFDGIVMAWINDKARSRLYAGAATAVLTIFLIGLISFVALHSDGGVTVRSVKAATVERGMETVEHGMATVSAVMKNVGANPRVRPITDIIQSTGSAVFRK